MQGTSATIARRSFLKQVVLAGAGMTFMRHSRDAMADAPGVLHLGSRRELFVDDYLIEELGGGAKLHMHRPAPQEVVVIYDRPWEGNTSAYVTLFRDDAKFRMYYRGWHHDGVPKKSAHPELACYAESRDGIHWKKPNLGLVEFQGNRRNNIVWNGIGTHNFTPFKDSNPRANRKARYKALARGEPEDRTDQKIPHGLFAFGSPDGIHWTLLQKEPVITEGAFDSQNLAFWDSERKRYAAYHRHFRDGIRDIMTECSDDFLHWTRPEFLSYGDAPKEHLYTNAIQPYFRAPHLFIGFPTRFQPATEQVEPVLMTSRDTLRFNRWPQELIPITAPKDRDGNRSNYMAHGLLELPGRPGELSVYATEAYYAGPGSRLRRFTYRTDGFASLRATDQQEGELITRLFRFSGDRLHLNVAAREGHVRVELQNSSGTAIPGRSLADCRPIQLDAIDHLVSWRTGQNLRRFSGQPVRLRISLRNADLFAMQFVK